MSSKYISTSATLSAAMNLRRLSKKGYEDIVKIDCEGLSCVRYIDLTKDDMRDKYLSSIRAYRQAIRFSEVLVTGYIPASHCTIES